MNRATHPRPRRALAASWLRFDLPEQLRHLKEEPEWVDARHNAITLAKDPGLSLLLVALRPGEQMREHRAPGPIAIQVVSGRIALQVGKERLNLRPGEVVTVNDRVAHSVEAIDESAFLLTIGAGGKKARPATSKKATSTRKKGKR